jgi:hypothetical protein
MSGGVRPAGRIPVWATDAEFPPYDGSKDWHGTDRKVDPGTAKEAAGWEPQEAPPAQYENWKDHQIGAHLQRLDCLEAMNWGQEFQIDDPNGNFYDLTWDPNELRVYVAGEDTAVAADLQWSNGGRYNWTSEASSLATPPTSLRAIRYFPEHLGLWTVGGTKGYWHESGDADTWTGYVLTSVVEAEVLTHDPYLGCMWMGGTITGPNPGIRKITGSTGASWAAVGLGSAASYANKVTDIAVASGRRVALMRHATAAMLWGSTSVDGLTAWTRYSTAPFLGENPRGLVYSAELDLFVVTTANGKCYVSPTGATNTWTMVANLSTLTPVGHLFGPGLLARGSLLIAGVAIQGVLQGIGHSRDGGVTWDIQGNPGSRGLLKILEADHRPVLVSDTLSGATGLQYGIRLRY